MKRPNLKLIVIEEGEIQFTGTENIFNNIIEKNFPNLKKNMPMKIQKLYRASSRLDQKKKVP